MPIRALTHPRKESGAHCMLKHTSLDATLIDVLFRIIVHYLQPIIIHYLSTPIHSRAFTRAC